MKKNSFDPFMINNFSDIVKQSRPVSISPNDSNENDLMGMTFVAKSGSIRMPKVRTGLVLLITSDSIGENNDLGISLMKNFVESILSGLEIPEYIILVNTGVKMILDANVIDVLKKLKKQGVKMITSVESMNYFKLDNCKFTQSWAVGDITTVLMTANKVIQM